VVKLKGEEKLQQYLDKRKHQLNDCRVVPGFHVVTRVPGFGPDTHTYYYFLRGECPNISPV